MPLHAHQTHPKTSGKTNFLYSVRMRASITGRHVSGAERIVSAEKIDETAYDLKKRALDRGCISEDIIISVDAIQNNEIQMITSLDLVTISVDSADSGRKHAAQILRTSGVEVMAIQAAFANIGIGAALSGSNMRGAMIMDAASGERLEPDQERGIRASRFDWTSEAYAVISHNLREIGLTHFRTMEALALATKVAHGPGIIAELCWSDEPEYTAGYVASRSAGYVRFPHLKEPGDNKGGRVFFVNRDSLDLDSLVIYLEKKPVLIDRAGCCRSAVDPKDYVIAAK
jgi:6-carboxyhexanoate--CoA ligase